LNKQLIGSAVMELLASASKCVISSLPAERMMPSPPADASTKSDMITDLNSPTDQDRDTPSPSLDFPLTSQYTLSPTPRQIPAEVLAATERKLVYLALGALGCNEKANERSLTRSKNLKRKNSLPSTSNQELSSEPSKDAEGQKGKPTKYRHSKSLDGSVSDTEDFGNEDPDNDYTEKTSQTSDSNLSKKTLEESAQFDKSQEDKSDPDPTGIGDLDTTAEQSAKFLEKLRVRNRLAARRSRQRQMNRIEYLEEELSEIQTQNEDIEITIRHRKEEISSLISLLQDHTCILEPPTG